jgi:hypothetical protein
MGAIGLGLASAVAFGGATFLAFHDKVGWGWLIIAGIVSAICATGVAAR